MPRYAATVPIYIHLDSQILDIPTKVALTKIVARGIARDRIPSGFRLRDGDQHFTVPYELAPAEIAEMQLAAQASGCNMYQPFGADLDIIHEYACLISEQDPVAFSKIPRMNLADLWKVASAWCEARRLAAEEAEALRLKLAPLHLADCPTVHSYDDGWRWVHVTGADALVAEGNLMGHCVGNGAYTRLTGMSAILSLRDPKGMPRVTAQLEGDRLVMAKGRSNSEPVNYRKRVDQMVRHCGA